VTHADNMSGLPAEALVRQGIADLEAGRRTIAGLLVSVARTRFERTGLLRPGTICEDQAELELYRMLRRDGGDAYARYNALIQELTSFERALDRRIRSSQERDVKEPA
jgi:hypothetical protein